MIGTPYPYPKMKDSGIPWLGEVPEHWRLPRLGALLRERGETNGDGQVSEVLSVLRERGVIPYAEKGNIGNKKSEDITRYKVVKPDDIVVNCMNVIIGSVGLSRYTGCLSPVYYVLTRRSEHDHPRYLNAYFQTKPFQESLVRIGNGILAHRMRIPMELLKCKPFPDYNSEYSDRPFGEKRDMQGGFKESPLRLNEGLGALDTWNETTIQIRAKRLAEQAVQVWAPPVLSSEVLEAYRPKVERPAGYTLDDHLYLAENSPMRQLFETFRKEVLALNPCVSEVMLHRYVAYKVETNFVDVVAQKSRLCLFFNLHFYELHDPRGLGRDMTGLGHSGNGDVEVALSTPDELPYVMGLVRQAFERQMGNGEAEA